MNRQELITTLREIVKGEIKEMLKSKEGKALLREIISKEVRTEVDHLLTEMEGGQDTKPIVQESKQEAKLTRMVERGELPPKANQPPKMRLAKNDKLNAILNQTLSDVYQGKAQLPSALGAEGQMQMLKEQYGGEWPTISKPQVIVPNDESSGKSVNQMLPSKDVNGNPLAVNPNALPDHIQKALTRDYSKLMKKVEEKRG